ncbi:MAG: zinc-dependent metalloprotease [Bacteroidetes bacterium]|nr:zinc-dependent metalloprotease [Bacteroidota bacterium]
MLKHFLLLIFAVAVNTTNYAQLFSKKKKQPAKDAKAVVTSTASTSSTATKTIAETIKKCRKIEGLFTLYQDSAAGNTFLLVKKNQLDKEYIFFSHTTDGVLAAGHFRGAFSESKIFKPKKYFNKIEFEIQNTNYYFDPKNPISKAANANISNATLAAQTIVAEDKEKGEYLIKSDDLFLSEAFRQVKYTAPTGFFSLGSLSKEKSKYVSIKSYPANTDIVVEYVYDNSSPTVRGGLDIADDRYVSIKVQHSLIEVPSSNFKPRLDDPRIGYFTERVNDMTTRNATNYRDVISRWHLEKKDKDALISEPVEPIVWWIENTTPIEYRETIKTAGLRWNEAFEKAGFKNAIEIRIQPDTADWDAGDIRYNVLRWTSSPQPPFGGYGPCFDNPRTGQIIGADIMLEYIFITNRVRLDKLFNDAPIGMMDELLNNTHNENFCMLNDYMHESNLFGQQVLAATGATAEHEKELIKESIYYLVLHEMGHTLGLNHNMMSSQLNSIENINKKEITETIGLTGSVMDYPAVNISPDRTKQGNYYTTKPGPYDKWAIEYAYSVGLDDEEAEKKRLNDIASRSTQPELAFGNDADDMRSSGSGIDPRINVGDMSSDAITYASSRMDLCNSLIPKLKAKYSQTDKSYQELKNAYGLVMNEYSTSSAVISRYVGGVYIDRAFVGQTGAKQPYTPVSYADQKRAMKALVNGIFNGNTFKSHQYLYNYLQTQRRSFDFFGTTEDPKLHQIVLNVQLNTLVHFFSPKVLKRITDSELYGNTYKLGEVFTDLTSGIFSASNTNTFAQNLQVEYTDYLLMVMDNQSRYDNITIATIYNQLKTIEKNMSTYSGGSKATNQLIAYKIKTYFDKRG